MLPKDPFMLLSVLNLKLRDHYPSLEQLCEDMGEEETIIRERLSRIGYQYDEENNQFR